MEIFLAPDKMAGAEGFEPPLAVLETAGLPLNLRPFSVKHPQLYTILLNFLVWLMLPAFAAKLLHFEPLGRGFLVFSAGVIPVLALAALECDDFPHRYCSRLADNIRN